MRAPEPLDRRDAGWLLLALLCLGLTAGIRPLMLPDEGRYVGVAWEMLQRGDWLTPVLDGLPFFHKPPLFYWLTAASLHVFGPQEWAARLAPWVGASLGLVSVYLLTRRWAPRPLAAQVALVLLAQPLFYVGGQFANLDMLVAGCITATVALLADAALSLEAGRPARATLWAAYAMAGLGVLAKGLIGVVLPGLVIALWLLLTRRGRLVWRLLSLPGVALLLAVAAPWFVLMQQRYPGFWDYFFVYQHFKRFATSGFNNVQPFWFYPVLLLLCFLPWWAGLWRARRAGAEAGGPTPLRALMWIWVVAIVGFFSLPSSKLVGYVLPAVPPLAWLAAAAWPGTGRWPAARWVAMAAGLLVSAAVLVAVTVKPRHSAQAVAQALHQGRVEGEPVLMVDDYFYDVPFYARLTEPVQVVEDWADPDVMRRDNWRKELADAGQFAPDVAARLLVPHEALTAVLCQAPRSWVVVTSSDAHKLPAGAQRVVSGAIELWRFDRAGSTACNTAPAA